MEMKDSSDEEDNTEAYSCSFVIYYFKFNLV